MFLVLALFLLYQPAMQETRSAQGPIPVEVVQIMELPINITDAVLVKTNDGYRMKCQVTNNSDSQAFGLTYILAVVDSMNVVKTVVSRSEGLRLNSNQTKILTFRTTTRLKLSSDHHLVLIVQRVVNADYLWEVAEAKDCLETYLRGDYSGTPKVVKIRNQVDTPLPSRVIY